MINHIENSENDSALVHYIYYLRMKGFDLNRVFEDDNFEKRFSFYYDYDANQLPSTVLTAALDVIYERITQDIFNESLAKW